MKKTIILSSLAVLALGACRPGGPPDEVRRCQAAVASVQQFHSHPVRELTQSLQNSPYANVPYVMSSAATPQGQGAGTMVIEGYSRDGTVPGPNSNAKVMNAYCLYS